jgi:hypothetical protein
MSDLLNHLTIFQGASVGLIVLGMLIIDPINRRSAVFGLLACVSGLVGVALLN